MTLALQDVQGRQFLPVSDPTIVAIEIVQAGNDCVNEGNPLLHEFLVHPLCGLNALGRTRHDDAEKHHCNGDEQRDEQLCNFETIPIRCSHENLPSTGRNNLVTPGDTSALRAAEYRIRARLWASKTETANATEPCLASTSDRKSTRLNSSHV